MGMYNNDPILKHSAMSLYAQDTALKTQEALKILTSACALDPRNPQLWFQRALILMNEGDLHGTVEALCIVKEHAPKEPPVYSMLGQVYYKLGRVSDALRNINIAIDLDPKEATVLKALMEQMEQADVVVEEAEEEEEEEEDDEEEDEEDEDTDSAS